MPFATIRVSFPLVNRVPLRDSLPSSIKALLAAYLFELRHNGREQWYVWSGLARPREVNSQREKTVEEASFGKNREEKERKFCGMEVLPENSIRNQHLFPKPVFLLRSKLLFFLFSAFISSSKIKGCPMNNPPGCLHSKFLGLTDMCSLCVPSRREL